MGTLILAVISLLLYSVGTALQALHFRGQVKSSLAMTTTVGVLALVGHALLISQIVHHDGGFDFSIVRSSLIISWLITFLLLGLNLTKPLQNLLLGVYPIAGLSIIIAFAAPNSGRLVEEHSYGMLTHIALSITAYSLFSLAAIQAALLYVQNRQLKRNYNSRLIRNLPPLQTVESVLFELVWAGVVLLVLAIVTGALFVEDLFAQDVAHKSLFSLLSLLVFIALLVGRHTKGWRGLTASRWTLAGCTLLMVAFYGSKLALELIFHRGL